jgi:hypothetical protein
MIKAGVKEVRVIDHTFSSGEMCLEFSSIHAAVAEAGRRFYTIKILGTLIFSKFQVII